jgi:hypothetical protein
MRLHRPALSALYWGALWGAALGIWMLGPRVARVHHVVSAAASEWLVLGFSLVVLFAFLGAVLGFETGLALVTWTTLRRHVFREPSLVYALAMPPLLLMGYLAAAALLEWHVFGQLIGYGGPEPVLFVAALSATWTLLVRFFYEWALKRGLQRRLGSVLAALAVVGMVVLPLRTSGASLFPPARSPDLERVAHGHNAPLLFVGIDSGNWRVLDALLQRARAPFFASMLQTGAGAQIRALWPPYWSAPAWAAIVTGYPPKDSGVHEDLIASAPGLPTLEVPLTADLVLAPVFQIEYGLVAVGVLSIEPPSRTCLRREPFWEMLTRAGARTAVVRFNFTYPARGEATFEVSDRAGIDEWAPFGVVAGTGPNLVYPPSEADALMAPFSGKALDPKSSREVLPRPGAPLPRNARGDTVDVLPLALATDERVLDAGESLIRDHPDLDLLALYLKGFDLVCHLFWPYRFPEDFPSDPPPEAERLALGPVMDRYFEFLDRRLASLASAFPRPPNILVVADHGAEASDGRSAWRGWHAEHGGLFVVSGPSVAKRDGRPEVTYFDVVPTALDLLGFSAPWLNRGVALGAARSSAQHLEQTREVVAPGEPSRTRWLGHD